jgi:hypothetical protein
LLWGAETPLLSGVAEGCELALAYPVML